MNDLLNSELGGYQDLCATSIMQGYSEAKELTCGFDPGISLEELGRKKAGIRPGRCII